MLQKNITYNFFDDLYGSIPDEQHRPSYNLIPSDESKEEDKKNKGLLVKAKVHGVQATTWNSACSAALLELAHPTSLEIISDFLELNSTLSHSLFIICN